MKKINFELNRELHDRYAALKKINSSITINDLVHKGLKQAQEDILKKYSLHKIGHSLKN